MNEDRTAGGEGTGASPDEFAMWTPGRSDNALEGLRGQKVILYGRVSTEEQAREGYSLDDQIAELNQEAARNGWEVVARVKDEGGSGTTLNRQGIARIRELVETEKDVRAVVAHKRDRISRVGPLRYLFEEELGLHGCKLTSLDDPGDESPMGMFVAELRDAFSKLELATILERTNRGKWAKTRKGKILRTAKPPYGFRYTDSGDALIIHEPEMAIVERIHRWAAEGLGPTAIRKRLHDEGVPSPTGKPIWCRPVIKRMVLENDLYFPRTVGELAGRVADEVLANLDGDVSYGLWYYNRQAVKETTVTVLGADGKTLFKKHAPRKLRPREEWLAVPIPAFLPRWLVERARAVMGAQRARERKYEARPWELRGIVRCGRCGSSITVKTTKPNKRTYHYYICEARMKLGKMSQCTQESIRAQEVEEEVWAYISGLLRQPERLVSRMEALADRERTAAGGGVSRRLKELERELDAIDAMRKRYHEMAARGHLGLDELGAYLNDLKERRARAEEEVRALHGSRARLERLAANKESVLEGMASMASTALERATPEDRRNLYKMLGLRVTTSEEGYELEGVFCGLERPSTAT